MMLFETIAFGDQVTIRLGGEERTGRATMHNKKAGLWVLNIDSHPGIAHPDNVVKVVKRAFRRADDLP